jgi:zinc protease
MDADLTQIQLNNGLLVMLKEVHTAPLTSYWMWYRVGSRDEKPGITGASHWVEHMQFKGTPDFPAGSLDKAISREGGYWNAMTYLDWTTYFATMPADKGDLILRLEADRMRSTVFDPKEVESERTVIISERQGNENSPLFQLDEAVQNAGFKQHGYRHEIVGNMPDLESMSLENLFQHYQKYYLPNNAVLSIAGDFETEAMLRRVKELFEPISSGEAPPRNGVTEPPQAEEQRVVVEGPGETAFVNVSYHPPPTTSEDFFIFTVLDSLLTGPSNLNLFGGGISNKTSLLYQELVETEIAISVAGGLQATIDPYLYTIAFTVHPGRKPEEVVAVLDRQIAQVQEALVGKETLEKAVKQARALFAYGSESITNQAFWLGFAEMFDDYNWFLSYLDRLAVVAPEDIQRVAQKYLRPENRVVGTYLPTGNGDAP